MTTTRRLFLGATVCGYEFLKHLPLVSADETRVDPRRVDFDAGLQPLVRLIEETPRAKLLEEVAVRIRKGASYRMVLGALLLAGVRNVQPRPAVGFKFHCVLVVNACHLASISGPDSDRWLPIFWALDYFKSAQADEAKRSGWSLEPVNESLVPPAHRAQAMFIEAMDTWDVEKADAATAGLVRGVGATQVFNLFARYAARDYRSIGHKAIYLANAWRTLQVIGWRQAEPVMRSLAFALLNHNGQPNPAKSDLEEDRPWRGHVSRLERIPAGWRNGKLDSAVTQSLLAAFREDAAGDAANVAADALAKGAGPQSIWDGVLAGAGELLMRQPGIIGLHGLTTANAMRFLWQHAEDDALRKRLLLQACAFNPMFRGSAKGRGDLRAETLEVLRPPTGKVDPKAASDEAFAELWRAVSGDRMAAAGKVRDYLAAGGSVHRLVDEARRLLFAKGRDAHDYKFTSAVLEDYARLSEDWRDTYFATIVFNLKGSGHPDSGLVKRTQAAVG